jgi:DNA polymerase sigma
VYGSAGSGFALPTSDIDIGICGLEVESKEEVKELMEELAKSLRESMMAMEVQVIQSASVPVIKMVFNLGMLRSEWKGQYNKIDITFDTFSEEQHPIKYGVLFTEWIAAKRKELPYLFPLVMLAKRLLSLRNLNIPYHGISALHLGGLSSYVLTLIVSGFLKICPGCPTAAHSFVEFLRYYAQDFDTTKMFVDRGEFVVVVPVDFLKMPDLLVVDPFRIGVNAARSVTRFEEIQDEFEHTFDKVIEMLKIYEDKKDLQITIDRIFEVV